MNELTKNLKASNSSVAKDKTVPFIYQISHKVYNNPVIPVVSYWVGAVAAAYGFLSYVHSETDNARNQNIKQVIEMASENKGMVKIENNTRKNGHTLNKKETRVVTLQEAINDINRRNSSLEKEVLTIVALLAIGAGAGGLAQKGVMTLLDKGEDTYHDRMGNPEYKKSSAKNDGYNL